MADDVREAAEQGVCTRHAHPFPAHTWSSVAAAACRCCPRSIGKGEAYVCVQGGVAHLRCAARGRRVRHLTVVSDG